MYSTCIFCHSNLGANEAVEHFPIGRRLAFDAVHGRLWVVCRKCERWNLSPIEERWEAIEECERLFRDTRLRVSTENVGLARVREGLELVRVGSPLRPEMAAWRYGDQFGRRRRKHLAYIGAGAAAVAGLVVLGPVTGIIAGSSWGMWSLANWANTLYQARRVRARLALPEFPAPVAIRLKQLHRLSIVRVEQDWGLRILFEAPSGETESPAALIAQKVPRWLSGDEIAWLVTGDAALHAAGKLLPAMNAAGAKRGDVESAVELIGEESEPAELFRRYAGQWPAASRPRGSPAADPGHSLINLPTAVRLALEMAAHEDSERRALEGELALLEAAWREAEEIAAISDDMFVPDSTRARISDLTRDDDRA